MERQNLPLGVSVGNALRISLGLGEHILRSERELLRFHKADDVTSKTQCVVGGTRSRSDIPLLRIL